MFASTSSRLAAVAALSLLSGCTLLMQGTWETVHFETRPPGAAFTVAGLSGVTPVDLEIPKNEHLVVFRKPGYDDQAVELKLKTSSWFYGSIAMGVISSVVDILSGAWKTFESLDVQVKLHPKAGTIEELPLKIESDPPGAEILVGNAVRGVTPREVWLTWADAQTGVDVTVRRDGYRSKTTAVSRNQAALSVALDPEPVAIRVQVFSMPEGADVIVDGVLEGRTPVTITQQWLPDSRPRSVVIKKDGHRATQLGLTREDTRLEAKLEEIEEERPLALHVVPAAATMDVDGAPATSRLLRWSPSLTKHKVRFSHPGYAAKEVEVARGEAETAREIRLSPMLPRF